MTGQIAARVQLALVGAVGGALAWAVLRSSETGWIGHTPAFMLFGLVLTAFGAFLTMAGPIGLARAMPRALALGLAVAGLIGLITLRYTEADDLFNSPIPALALFVVATLPLPFLIAATRTGWRDYPALFLEAWSIVLRTSAAGTFAGLVWLVIYLSDAVLGIVGIDLIGRLLEHELVVLVLLGAIFGLGMAVIDDLAEVQLLWPVLRVLRLFLPVVLGVTAVFLVALPFRGLDGLVSGLSPAGLLLTMVAGGIGLVTITIDRTDADAAQSLLLQRSAQGMALVLPVMAGLALWAIGIRVSDHGWTPERMFIVVIASVGVGYGLVYAASVLRGGAWMERIRQGNIVLALVSLVLAVLWLTPVLNAERISAQSQLARFKAGTTPVEDLDVYAIRFWGKPGAEAIATLETIAKEPGQEALAKLLSGSAGGAEPDRDGLAARLALAMPVQPATATGTRTMLLDAAEVYQLQDWQQVCEMELRPGHPGCLMVVADLLPSRPGEEAMLFLQRSEDYTEVSGLYLDDAGVLVARMVTHPDGRYLDATDAAALLQQFQETPPPVTAAELNQLGTGAGGLLFLP
jgi:Domain of unknown function (DUF4153)